jgi:hypothetical protein
MRLSEEKEMGLLAHIGKGLWEYRRDALRKIEEELEKNPQLSAEDLADNIIYFVKKEQCK